MIKIDYSNMMYENLGERGIKQEELSFYEQKAKEAFDGVSQERGKGMQEWMDLPYNQNEVVEDILATAKEVAEKYENFVLLGIGGSALGPIALFNALCNLYHNELPSSKREAPRFYVLDNVDPEKISALLNIIEPKKTMFNIITKSGSTSETMSQYLLICDILKKAIGKNFADHIVATTSKTKGNLIKLAKQNNFKTFYIPDGVGGRFSLLCPVGLFPAAVLGIDIKALLAGAAKMDEVCSSDNIAENPALLSAVLLKIAYDSGTNICVLMPYAEKLKNIGDWFCQLWAESLGKQIDKQGNIVHTGQTPVRALGVTDQHSQIQLYTEGPFDKVIVLLQTEKFDVDITIPNGCEEYENVNFLCNHTLSELMTTELDATRHALTKSAHANYSIILPKVDEDNMGQLLQLLMLQTAYMGELLNIDTYNQPGVEEGKNATYALFGRKGYEDKAKELKDAKTKKYVI